MGYNKITLHSGQRCDYLYATKNETITDETYTRVSDEPLWDGSAALLSSFNEKKLIGGDPNLESSLVGCEIRRKRNAEPFTEYVTTIDSSQNGFVIDYAVTNNAYYTYFFYPQVMDAATGEIRALKPLISDQIKTSWNYWTLMAVDETERENVFYLSKMFFFQYNVESGAMSNNTDFNVSKNFTRYPFVQFSNANYWSSTLSGLLGGVSCPDGKYYQTLDMLKDIKELTTDGKRKFLKDIEGNLFEVSLVEPVSIENDDSFRFKKKALTWAEVGDAKGVSIINHPTNTTNAWLLTDSGISRPYLNYSWMETGVWEPNKILTSGSRQGGKQ